MTRDSPNMGYTWTTPKSPVLSIHGIKKKNRLAVGIKCRYLKTLHLAEFDHPTSAQLNDSMILALIAKLSHWAIQLGKNTHFARHLPTICIDYLVYCWERWGKMRIAGWWMVSPHATQSVPTMVVISASWL